MDKGKGYINLLDKRDGNRREKRERRHISLPDWLGLPSVWIPPLLLRMPAGSEHVIS